MVRRRRQKIPVWLWLIGIVLAMSFLGFDFFAGVPLNEPEVDTKLSVSVQSSGSGDSDSESTSITIPKGSYIDIITASGRVRTSNSKYSGGCMSSCSATASVSPYFYTSQSSSNLQGGSDNTEFEVLRQNEWLRDDLTLKLSVSTNTGNNFRDSSSSHVEIYVHYFLDSDGDRIIDLDDECIDVSAPNTINGCPEPEPETEPITEIIEPTEIMQDYGNILLIIIFIFGFVLIINRTKKRR